jgi:hypothetical protein
MAELKYLTVSLTEEEQKRIFSHIAVDPDTECWNWTASVRQGYSQTYYRRNVIAVHRLLYAWIKGPIPKGNRKGIPVLDHLCNNPRCCNPDHLHLVSQRENLMRGSGTPAINARKTHCKRGHLLPSEPNRDNGSRRCLICQKEDNHNYRPSEERRKYKIEYLREYRRRKH